MRYWTSDLHLSHANIIKYCDRPFKDTVHMNNVLRDNWNDVVGVHDEVWVLGDVALGEIKQSLPLLHGFHGWKYLVPGNHDRIFSGAKPAQIEKHLDAYLNVFTDIYPEITTAAVEGQIVNVSHFPYIGDHSPTDRYADKRPKNNGLPLICGHVHGAWRSNGNQLNVGVDVHDYRPVSEDTVADWLENIVVNKYYS